VRMVAIELLNHLREGGLLEPNDIDAVGRLVFDLEFIVIFIIISQ
jgi:cohesin complex subunit SA-1/2